MADIKVFSQYDKYKIKVASFKEEATMISISSDSDKDSAMNTKKQLQKFRKDVDNARKFATEPYRDFVKKINDAGNAIVDDAKAIENKIDSKLLAYDQEIERKKRERQDKVKLIISKLYECKTFDEVDDILMTLDIDDAQITLAVTHAKTKIKDEERRVAEEKKRKEEDARLAAIQKKAQEDAEAQQALADEAKKIEDERRERELKKWKEEQQEVELLEEAESDVLAERIEKKQEAQSSAVKWKRKVLEFSVTDPKLVPDEYKTVDEKKIRAALKAKLVDSIPGVTHSRVDKIR